MDGTRRLSLIVGVITLLVMLVWPRLKTSLPPHLPAVIIATVIAAAMNQQGFALLQNAPLEDVMPDSKKGFRKPRRLFEGQSCRNRQALTRRDGHVFGITTTAEQRTNPVSHFPALGIRSDFDDFAGHLQTRYR